MTDEKKLNIHQRILKVIAEVGAIEKDVTVTEGGRYQAVSHDAVTRHLRKHMVRHGVVRVVHLDGYENAPTGQTTQRGAAWNLFRGQYTVEYINADQPSDRIAVQVVAMALDFGDKGPGKALSYATKTADLKMFLIPTGEDDEERPAETDMVPAPLSAEQRADVFAKAEELFGGEADKVLQSMAEKVFQIPDRDWNMIRSADCGRALNALQRKADQDAGNSTED